MTYRLAPGHVWPAGAQDVAAAVGWLQQNIAAYGGDPGKIVVAGNSAGAVHVASYVAGQGGGDPAGIAGAALLSGIYQIHKPAPGEPEHVYYGADPNPAASSLPGLLDTIVPLLFSVAERDPARFQREAAGVVSAWVGRHGTVPDLVWVEGHNHMSTIASLTVDEPALGTALARFIDRHTRTKGTAQ
jgi:triacylglycerol lipase